jgi:hypothetical protein
MNEFSIPLQPLTTATGSQSSKPITLSPQVMDALRYWQSCPEEDKEAAAAFVRELLAQQTQQKGTTDAK